MHQTLIVADESSLPLLKDLPVITFQQYLAEYPKLGEPATRVINLCDTGTYLSQGYYCSLLAEARQHKVLPGVNTINDLRHMSEAPLSSLGIKRPSLPAAAENLPAPCRFSVLFGWTEDEAWRKLARQVFDKYPAPIFELTLIPDQTGTTSNGLMLQIRRLSPGDLPAADQPLLVERLRLYTEQVWRTPGPRRQSRWDMAILVNPQEKNPPSDDEALKRFIKAAAKVGIEARLVSADDLPELSLYDALFIRETTAIDHPTYRLARKAEREGLVVMDDSQSILRCCNKVFLHDAFSYNKVPAPKTRVTADASAETLSSLEKAMPYPMVLKMPEGSFSNGVFKVADRQQLASRLQEMLSQSALVLVQEYLYTDFDWRIGVLNGRPIYACQYQMARGHWQIYNHESKRYFSGDFETLPTFEVPKPVLDAATKAAAIIGRGLYGVDIKQKDNKVYVIEVNDNPSIDHHVEDKYLGNELYMLIMQEFANRLEQRGR